ncbi:MAG: DUF2706 domain-containing protein [Alphaproteobacteria bacterium]|nr:DUF2706 domain-containing protein [Alphaproteobacteria bacterium]
MKPVLCAVMALFVLSACTSKPHEVKSPCVGGDGSPCVKRPANNA